LASGATGFYWHITKYYRNRGCSIPDEPLGTSYVVACGEDGKGGRAAALNGLFDEWRDKRDGKPIEGIAKFGTVDWLFRQYKASKAYLERVSERTRPDYELLMRMVTSSRQKKATSLAIERSRRLLPFLPTGFMN
jgi:hypothetical protein